MPQGPGGGAAGAGAKSGSAPAPASRKSRQSWSAPNVGSRSRKRAKSGPTLPRLWQFRTKAWDNAFPKQTDLFTDWFEWVNKKIETYNADLPPGAPHIDAKVAAVKCLQKLMVDRLKEIQKEEKESPRPPPLVQSYAATATPALTNAAVAAVVAAAGPSAAPSLKKKPPHATIVERLAYFDSVEFMDAFLGSGPEGFVSRQHFNPTQKQKSKAIGHTEFITQVFQTNPVGEVRNYFEGVGVNGAGIQCDRALGKKNWHAAVAATADTDEDMICYLCGQPMFNTANTGRKWCNTAKPPKPDGKAHVGTVTFPKMECEHLLPVLTAVAHWSLWHKDVNPPDSDFMKEEYAYAHNCCNQIKGNIDLISFNKQAVTHGGELYKLNTGGINSILKEIQTSNNYDCPNAKGKGTRQCPDPITNRGFPPDDFKYDNSAFQVAPDGSKKGDEWIDVRIHAIRGRLETILKTINNNADAAVSKEGSDIELYLLFVRCKIIFAISWSQGRNNIDNLLRGGREPGETREEKEKRITEQRILETEAKNEAQRVWVALAPQRRQARLDKRTTIKSTTIKTQGNAGKAAAARYAKSRGEGGGKATDYDSSDFDDVPADFLLGWIINQRTEPEFKKRLYESFSDLLEGAGEAVPQSEHAGERVRAAEGAGEAVPQSEHATSDIMETPIPLSSSKRTQAALPENIEDTAKSGDTTAKVGDQFNPITAETLPLRATKGGSRRLVLGNAKLNRTISKASRAAQKRVGRGDLLRGRIFSKVKGKKTKKRKGKKILTRKKNTRKKRKTIREKKNKRRTNKHK